MRESTRRTATLVAGTLLAVLVCGSLAGCKGIDKSQWSTTTTSGSGTTTTRTTTTRTTTSGSNRSGGSGTTVVQQQDISINGSSGPLGVTSGSSSGNRSSTESTILVHADRTTCWILVVDGNEHRGCGDATITDTRGAAAARVTKTSGSGPIQLTLQSSGKTLDSGTVAGDGRYVTVAGAR